MFYWTNLKKRKRGKHSDSVQQFTVLTWGTSQNTNIYSQKHSWLPATIFFFQRLWGLLVHAMGHFYLVLLKYFLA